jgi:hypothetical protein
MRMSTPVVEGRGSAGGGVGAPTATLDAVSVMPYVVRIGSPSARARCTRPGDGSAAQQDGPRPADPSAPRFEDRPELGRHEERTDPGGQPFDGTGIEASHDLHRYAPSSGADDDGQPGHVVQGQAGQPAIGRPRVEDRSPGVGAGSVGRVAEDGAPGPPGRARGEHDRRRGALFDDARSSRGMAAHAVLEQRPDREGADGHRLRQRRRGLGLGAVVDEDGRLGLGQAHDDLGARGTSVQGDQDGTESAEGMEEGDRRCVILHERRHPARLPTPARPDGGQRIDHPVELAVRPAGRLPRTAGPSGSFAALAASGSGRRPLMPRGNSLPPTGRG